MSNPNFRDFSKFRDFMLLAKFMKIRCMQKN